MRTRLTGLAASLALVLAPDAAFAHPGIGMPSGFMHGFVHPVSGIDHILAMTMVGILAYQLGRRALWLLPAAFVAAMIVGGVLGITGIGIPFVESCIALSVVALGAILALGVKAPLATATGIVGLVGIFHGYAHGAEMPEYLNRQAYAYAAGFALMTASLHVTGILAICAIDRTTVRYGDAMARLSGGIASLAGVGLLFWAV